MEDNRRSGFKPVFSSLTLLGVEGYYEGYWVYSEGPMKIFNRKSQGGTVLTPFPQVKDINIL